MGWHPWRNVAGGLIKPGSPVSAVARDPNHLNVFATGSDGLTYRTWLD